MENHTTLPRLYVDTALAADNAIALSSTQTHYLKTVMRRQAGDSLRVFNGRDGEFTAHLTKLGKHGGEAHVKAQIRAQPGHARRVHCLFPPLKKHRLDILIEKGVELGVTDFHPVLTARTIVRKINTDRLNAQIIGATTQCERMAMPVLHALTPLNDKITSWQNPRPIHWCYERHGPETPFETKKTEDTAFLIGPVGGFTEEEAAWLSAQDHITPISFGDTVYRVETATLIFLAKLL